MLNLLKNNLFDYYLKNKTCNGCLLNIDNGNYQVYRRNVKIYMEKYEKFIKETGLNCSFCFFKFLQILKEENDRSYRKLLNYMLKNNNISYIFPCNDVEETKQIILNSIVAELELDIE